MYRGWENRDPTGWWTEEEGEKRHRGESIDAVQEDDWT